jgi:tRNA threonylcarbamoyl adenosine modification protein YeaZ
MKGLLAFDTATSTACVAVLDPESGRPLSSLEAPVKTHGRALVPMIQQAMAEASVRPEDLTAVACGRGPGSFTGLRVGLATAKGLCMGLDIPLVTPGSLEPLAMRAPPSDGLVVPCLDARRSEVYVSAVHWQDRIPPEVILPECAVGPEAVFELFKTAMDPAHAPPDGMLAPAVADAARQRADALSRFSRPLKLTLVGEGVERYREVFCGRGSWSGLDVEAAFFETDPPVPDAVSLGRIAAWMLERGDAADLDSAQPTYLRPSDAEAKFKVDLSPK